MNKKAKKIIEKNKKKKSEKEKIVEQDEKKEEIKKISCPSIITVRDFAARLNLPVSDVISELIKNGVMATINENIDFETAAIIGEYLGFEVEEEKDKENQQKIDLSLAKKETSLEIKGGKERPPIVTILGHVDHGKTTLLDAIREANVAGGESGGITQHITAYQVEKKGKKITFIDTPGHEAFEIMRAHGARMNDIALLIVAADDGVKTQTIEAINHIKKAKTPLIVVINKIDLPNTDINRTKQQLADLDLIPEDWGGKTVFSLVSAKTKEGIGDLLDMILLIAEMEKLKANPNSPASGIVLESHLDYGRGPVATILIKNGTLRIQDSIQVGETFGKIKWIGDWYGKRVKEAKPSDPVLISGLKELPQFGEFLQAFSGEKIAREESERLKKDRHTKKISKVKKIKISKEKTEEGESSEEEKEKNELNLVLKADVVGSLEAIKESLDKLKTSEVSVRIVGEGVGGINESDIKMASVSDAIIIGFKIKLKAQIDQLAKNEGVKISLYNVIYELIDDIKEFLSDLLPPEKIEISIGKMEILKVFRISKKESIVGGKVTEGKLIKDATVRIVRNKEEIGQAKIMVLKKEKEIINEAISGSEYGVCLEIDFPISEKDIIEAYRTEERKRTL